MGIRLVLILVVLLFVTMLQMACGYNECTTLCDQEYDSCDGFREEKRYQTDDSEEWTINTFDCEEEQFYCESQCEPYSL